MNTRDVAAAWAYHDGTKHSTTSVRQSRHYLDWDIMPRPFKVYPTLEPIPLPHDITSGTRPALASLADGGTAPGPGPHLDRALLARLLYFSAGVLRRKTYPNGEAFFRAAACTGALYHIDLYLVCGPLADLEAGVYHFGPHDFALRRLRAGDHRAALVQASGNEPTLATAPAILVFTSTFWRNSWKYQARAYRHAFWDSGTLLANLLAVAAGAALPGRIDLGFVDATVNGLLDLDVAHEVALGLVALGSGEPAPRDAPPAPSLALETLPLSTEEIDYPAIRAAHAASSLGTTAEVTVLRDPPFVPQAESPTEVSVALPPEPPGLAETIEQVILRRGSSRRFAREAIALDQLTAVLGSIGGGMPSDLVPPETALADLYLIANAVDGLAPGAYVHQPVTHALGLLRAGTFRREAAALGLWQDLAGDAAVCLFWLTDLAAVLARFGNRGYRVAQLEAAIRGGKAYLAAYAVGLGATGLTFFDDDATAFFSPHAAGKSVMFMVALGRRARGRSAAS